MGEQRHLTRRGHSWYFTRDVPRDLQGVLLSRTGKPRKRITLALHTTSLPEARAKRIDAAYTVERMFRDARGKLADARKIEADAEPEADTLDLITYHEDALAMLRGKARRPLVQDGVPFSRVAADYLKETDRDAATRLAAATIRQREAAFRLFADFTDDAPLAAIDRKMASSFLTTVSHLDPDWGKHPGAGKLPLAELLKRYGRGKRQLSNAAVNHYHSALKGVFDYAITQGDLDTGFGNPFAGLSRETADAKWVPYEPSELRALLTGARDTPLHWYVMVALYSAMRLGEICEAKIEREKIVGPKGAQLEGVRYFNITSAKTKAGIRKVPVHSKLIADGILKASVPRGTNLRAQYQGLSSSNVTKLFGRLRAKLGLTRDRLSFHSLRKNAVTALDRAGVSTTDIAVIVGHARSFSLDRYSGGPGLKRLQRIVEKIRY